MATRGRLESAELAEAAVLGDLAVMLVLAGSWLPAGGVLVALAVTPFVVVMVRHRLRALVVGGIASASVGSLVGGLGLAINVAGLAFLGALAGFAIRHRMRMSRGVALTVAVSWPVVAGLTDALLAVLSRARRLTLAQGRNTWQGFRRVASDGARLVHLDIGGPLGWVDRAVNWALAHWWLTIPAVEAVGLFLVAVVVYRISRVVLSRLQAAARMAPPPWPRDEGIPTGALPLRLTEASYVYRGHTRPALDRVSLDVQPGRYVAVVGANGSGKSTLARVIAGLQPTGGRSERPGAAGLGRPGGVAIVFQRPESQVLGARVRDDIRWGLPAAEGMAAGDALRAVGLDGFADRETATLSGGELQRVALAAALARHPTLLIADEATAMLDIEGRVAVVETLHRLVVEQGVTVVSVTHHIDELRDGDELVQLDAGRRVPPSIGAAATALPRHPGGRSEPVIAAGRGLELDHVGYVHAARSPWAHRALSSVNLAVGRGEGVLIVGPNGSGKTTLAWVIAGLLPPTEGVATFDGEAVALARVAVGFQHARLQLFRPTVAADVALGGASRGQVEEALRTVSLDPAVYGSRSIDALSGGEQRRVALAGLVVRRPDLLVLDEPFAGLDPPTRGVVVDALTRLRSQGLTIVLVSHDAEEGLAVCERVVGLAEGRVVFDGTASESEARRLMTRGLTSRPLASGRPEPGEEGR